MLWKYQLKAELNFVLYVLVLTTKGTKGFTKRTKKFFAYLVPSLPAGKQVCIHCDYFSRTRAPNFFVGKSGVFSINYSAKLSPNTNSSRTKGEEHPFRS